MSDYMYIQNTSRRGSEDKHFWTDQNTERQKDVLCNCETIMLSLISSSWRYKRKESLNSDCQQFHQYQ
jgi:hypothetical protein